MTEITAIQVQTLVGKRWHAYQGRCMIGIGMSEETAIRDAHRTLASLEFQAELKRQPDAFGGLARTEVKKR